MAHIFQRIIDGGYWVPFGTFTPAQQDCKDHVVDMIDDLFAVRQREKYIAEIKACICGYPPADESEPMVPENFSQFQFYLPIEQEIVAYVDRFDYLICCVANGVCKIHKGFEDRFERALLSVLTFRTSEVPKHTGVLDKELMKAPDPVYWEQGRSEAKQAEELELYLAKADPFSKAVKEELARLEAEEAAAEHRRREAADRAAGHDPFKITAADIDEAANSMADEERQALADEVIARSPMAQGLAPLPRPPIDTMPPMEDPTPYLTLVLTVKLEVEARDEIERRRHVRRKKVQQQNEAEMKAKADRLAAEQAAQLKAHNDAIAAAQAERIEAEKQAVIAQQALDEANRLRDIERTRMAQQLQQAVAADEQRRLEEANERERVARLAAEKAAKRQAQAAEREAIAREAAAREARRLQMEAGQQSYLRQQQ